MVRIAKSWVLVIGSVLLAGKVCANEPALERNYQLIIDRNPFGLKPPPPPPTIAPPVAPPKDEILLTGITSLGSARAYFMTKAPQGKDPEYYSLGIDEKKEGLEVLSIDTSEMSVRVRNGGVETVMTFASNGVKPPAATGAPPPGTPGAVPPGGVASGVMVPGAIGNRPMTPGVVTPGGGTSGSSGTITPGRIRTIPSRNVRALNPTPTPMVEPNQPPARPDPDAAVTDVLLMELQKRANPDVPFPPTPMPH